MAKETTYDTYIRIGGKVNPSLRRATNTACEMLNRMKASVLGAVGLASMGMAFNTIKTLTQKWVEMGSDLQETQGKIDVVFGHSADVIYKWGETTIKEMGLAQQTALDSAALYGDMATGMGINQRKAAEMAMTLTRLGADMASFKNISNDMAQTALKSVFTGETESLKNLGIVMTQANLQEFARTRGIKKKIEKLKEAEKVELRYQYVLSRTKNAQGDFVRTGMNAANQMRMYNETIKEIETNFGQTILPTYNKALTKVNQALVANLPNIQKTFDSMFNGLLKVYHVGSDVFGVIKTGFDYIIKYGPVVAGILTYIALATFITNINNIAWAVLGLGLRFGECAIAVGGLTKAGIAFAFSPLGIFLLGLVSLTVTLVTNWEKLTDIWEQAQNIKINPLKDLTPEEQQKVREYEARNRKAEISMPKKATGTDYAEGGPTLVGENGPEIVNLNKGDTVDTAMKTRGLFRNLGGFNNSFANNQQTGLSGGINVSIVIEGNADEQTIQSAATNAFQEFKTNFERLMQEKQRLGYAF